MCRKYGRDTSRIQDFYNYFTSRQCYASFAEFPCGYTTDTNHPYGVEVKTFRIGNESRINTLYKEESTQPHVDELSPTAYGLTGVLPQSVTSAYETIREAAKTYFKVFLRPMFSIEQPDMFLLSISRGAIIINVCEDITHFKEEFRKVEAIKAALFEIYMKNLKIQTIINSSIYNSIKTALYFPNNTEQEITCACNQYYETLIKELEQKNKTTQLSAGEDSVPRRNPTDFLVKLTRDNVTSRLAGISVKVFRYEFYEELLDLISTSWHPASQGDSKLVLTADQKRILENPNKRLRVKGIAGSGKTHLVAQFAVDEHLRTGTPVLIITFNITLIEYIKMKINQIPRDFSPKMFEIVNYHQFFLSKANRYAKDKVNFGDFDKSDYFQDYEEQIRNAGDTYQTIIVDEAQDYMSQWFTNILPFLNHRTGRYIVFGDGVQNIYERDYE